MQDGTAKEAFDCADEAWKRLEAMRKTGGSVDVLPDDKDALAELRMAYLEEKWGDPQQQTVRSQTIS